MKENKIIERIERPLFRIDKYVWDEMSKLMDRQKILSFYQWDIANIRIDEKVIKDAKKDRI